MSAQLNGLTSHVEHGPSHAELRTTPPADNGGLGDAFSPTDLVGAALLTCAITTMALISAREGLSWGDASGTVEKVMSPPPRRIAALTVVIAMSKQVKPEHRARLEEIARGCPVARSLHPDVKATMEFRY